MFSTDDPHWGTNVLWTLALGTMTWTPLAPAGGPPAFRLGQSTLFDPVRNRMILFAGGEGGGMSTGPQFNDVWALSLVGAPTWTEIHPSGALPMGRQYAGCIYDPVRDRMVIFAGAPDYQLTNYTDLNDVWALSLSGSPAWTQLQPSGTSPAATYSPGAIYDPLRDRMLIAGGSAYGGPGTAGQTWSLDLPSLQWTQLATTGSPRGGGRASTYDPPNDRLVSYGGGGTVTACNWS